MQRDHGGTTDRSSTSDHASTLGPGKVFVPILVTRIE